MLTPVSVLKVSTATCGYDFFRSPFFKKPIISEQAMKLSRQYCCFIQSCGDVKFPAIIVLRHKLLPIEAGRSCEYVQMNIAVKTVTDDDIHTFQPISRMFRNLGQF